MSDGFEDSNVRLIVDNYIILAGDGFFRDNTVTRFESIFMIMQAVGATDEHVPWDLNNMIEFEARRTGRKTYRMRTNEPYVIDFRFFHDHFPYNISMEFMLWPKSAEHSRYPTLAVVNDILKGEIVNGRRYIHLERPITPKEVLAFMVRCLQDAELLDIYQTFEIAIELGLISKTDSFYANVDKPISHNDFYVLLYRFLNQNRYLYFEPIVLTLWNYQGTHVIREGQFSVFALRDENRSMTYLEFLRQRQEATE